MNWMKRGIFFLLLFCSSILSAQNFYEIDWETDNVHYTALVMYYDQSNIDVRVKYSIDDVYMVAKYNCVGSYEYSDDGTRFFIFDGDNAEIVYQSEYVNTSYSADNFVFTGLNEANEFEELYTIDDASLESDDFMSLFVKSSFRQVDPNVDFDHQYVYNFFDEHEPEYELFLSLANNDPVVHNYEEPVTLYLVLTAATNDRSIGSSTAKDMQDIEGTFQKIAKELEIRIEVQKIYGDNFDREHITQAFAGINNTPNDIIMFYYSGHGYNATNANSTYPTMDLDGPDYMLEEVYRQVLAKSPRLALVFGDLCNSIPQTRSGTKNQGEIPFKSGYLFDNDKLETLFIHSKGSLLSTSSQKGQWSYCMTTPAGALGNGHFTHAFIESLIKETSKVSTYTGDWNAVIDRAYYQAANATVVHLNQDRTYGQKGYGMVNVVKR